MKQWLSVFGLVGVRLVNAWYYHTPLNVFVQRTVLFILMAYIISGYRAWRRERLRVRESPPSGV